MSSRESDLDNAEKTDSLLIGSVQDTTEESYKDTFINSPFILMETSKRQIRVVKLMLSWVLLSVASQMLMMKAQLR